jgi:hypothetical protein
LGTINEFIEPNKKATNAVSKLFTFDGMSIDIEGKRAISQVKAAISRCDHLLQKHPVGPLWVTMCCRQSRRHHAPDLAPKELILDGGHLAPIFRKQPNSQRPG